MAQRTQSDMSLQRPEVAAYLRALAEEFEREGEQISVEVGNKAVTLDPPQEVDLDVEVVERSSMLRGNRETIDLEFSWKP